MAVTSEHQTGYGNSLNIHCTDIYDTSTVISKYCTVYYRYTVATTNSLLASAMKDASAFPIIIVLNYRALSFTTLIQ